MLDINKRQSYTMARDRMGGPMVMESRNLLCMTQNEVLLDQISTVLTGRGYHLKVADSESGAISLLNEGGVDAVLLDVEGLSRQNITTAFAHLRQHWHGALLALIPEHASDEVVKAYEMGVDSHITIPFDSRELAARVEAILRRVRAKRRFTSA